MKKIKSAVIGYQQIEYNGSSTSPWIRSHVYSKFQIIEMSKAEQSRGRIKSKFRPVYKKQSNET